MNANEFLRLLAQSGGRIISTAGLTQAEIDEAREEDRFYVDDDGLGYVYEPPE
jgi:hypothetical protein